MAVILILKIFIDNKEKSMIFVLFTANKNSDCSTNIVSFIKWAINENLCETGGSLCASLCAALV